MPFISVTRLRIRRLRFLPPFSVHVQRTRQQLRHAPGFQGGFLQLDRRLTFWTITAWGDQDSMRRYMASGAHRLVMPRLLDWCDEASVVHWSQPDPALPSMAEADRRMRVEGRPSKVRHPSPQHETLSYRAPHPTFGGPVTPSDRSR